MRKYKTLSEAQLLEVEQLKEQLELQLQSVVLAYPKAPGRDERIVCPPLLDGTFQKVEEWSLFAAGASRWKD